MKLKNTICKETFSKNVELVSDWHIGIFYFLMGSCGLCVCVCVPSAGDGLATMSCSEEIPNLCQS